MWHLLFEGHLPTAAERDAFAAEVKPMRVVPPSVAELLPALAASSQTVMEGVRSAMSMVGAAEGFKPTLDIDHAERRRNALQLCAVMPTLIMAIHRLQQGQEPIAPREDLGYGANYLWMLTGDEFDKDLGRAVEQYQITTIDHGFNASTFTSRVICSSGADVAAAVVGGMGALSGPLHGGAPSRALALLEAIGTVENARPYLVDHVTRGEKIMGFGHRVYKTTDPRSEFLRGVAERIHADKVEFAKVVEQTVVDVLAELKPGRNLYANVEFYAGVVMDHCGLPPELFTPDLRVEPGHRLVRQHPRAGRRQPDHPPVRQVRRPTPAPARPRSELTVPVTVTIATADDAEELHAALQHLVPQLSRSNPPPSLDEVRAMLTHDSVTQFLARRDDGSIVGRQHPGDLPDPHRHPCVDRGRDRRRGEQQPGHRPPAHRRHGRARPPARRQDRRPHQPPQPRGRQPPLPEGRLRGPRHERVPVRAGVRTSGPLLVSASRFAESAASAESAVARLV